MDDAKSLAGHCPLNDALMEYERQRNQATMAEYRENVAAADSLPSHLNSSNSASRCAEIRRIRTASSLRWRGGSRLSSSSILRTSTGFWQMLVCDQRCPASNFPAARRMPFEKRKRKEIGNRENQHSRSARKEVHMQHDFVLGLTYRAKSSGDVRVFKSWRIDPAALIPTGYTCRLPEKAITPANAV
jgi:hypothetical protein